jgi:hypothetical protein
MHRHLRADVAVVAVVVAASLAMPAAAGACGKVISPAAVASALHLGEGAEELLLVPPGPAWSVESTCVIDAWTGTRPLSRAAIEAGFASGTYAVVSINTWAPASGLFLAGVQLKGFRETLASITKEARTQLVKGLHGTSFKPHPHGAHASGWKATTPTARVARAVWSEHTKLRIIEIGVRGARKHSAVAGLERIAASAVPAFEL